MATVAAQLSKVCSCSLSVRYIANTELTCGDHTTDRVILEGAIIALNKISETKLHQLLQGWVDNSPTMEVTGVSLQVIKCSTSPLDKDSCLFKEVDASSSSLPPTGFKVEVVTLKAAKDSPGSIPITVYGGAGGGVVVVLGVTCFVAMIIWRIRCKRSQAYKTDRYAIIML